MGQLTEDVLVFQRFDQGTLVLVRNEIAALGVSTHLQGIEHLVGHRLGAHGVPEVLCVAVPATTSLADGFIFHTGGRSGGQGLAGSFGHFHIHGFHLLHPGDLPAELVDIVHHLIEDGVVLSGQRAVFTAMALQKRLGGVPALYALIAHFHEFFHNAFPPQRYLVFSKRFSAAAVLTRGSSAGAFSGSALGTEATSRFMRQAAAVFRA